MWKPSCLVKLFSGDTTLSVMFGREEWIKYEILEVYRKGKLFFKIYLSIL